MIHSTEKNYLAMKSICVKVALTYGKTAKVLDLVYDCI